MNLVKVAIIMKNEFYEVFDIKKYRIHSREQFVIKRYSVNNQKIIVDEER